MEQSEVARYFFQLGTLPLMVAGFLHALGSVGDVVQPRLFIPVNDEVRRLMSQTGLRLIRRTSMWLAWLGFNISHGLGAFGFGLLCLLISVHDFETVKTLKPFLPFTIFRSLSYFLLAIRFWFYAPAIATGFSTACFALSYLMV